MRAWLQTLAAAFVFLTLCGCVQYMHEPYLALYGGRADIGEGSIKGSIHYSPLFPPTPPDEQFNNSYDSDEGAVLGLRYGCWGFDPLMDWCGAAVDLSMFGLKSDEPNTKIDVYPISLLVLVRYPGLLYEEKPWFRIYPYLGAGPSLVTGSLSTEALLNSGSTYTVKVTAFSLGYDARAGCAWALSDRIQLFVEYRYLYSHMSGSSSSGGYVDLGKEELSTTVSTHQVVSGISYFF